MQWDILQGMHVYPAPHTARHLQDAAVLLLRLCHFQGVILKVVQNGKATNAVLLLSALGDNFFEVRKPSKHLFQPKSQLPTIPCNNTFL